MIDLQEIETETVQPETYASEAEGIRFRNGWLAFKANTGGYWNVEDAQGERVGDVYSLEDAIDSCIRKGKTIGTREYVFEIATAAGETEEEVIPAQSLSQAKNSLSRTKNQRGGTWTVGDLLRIQ